MAEQIKTEENKKFTIPEVIPMLSLHNALVFPKMMIPLEIVGGDAALLVDEAMTKDRLVGLINPKYSRLLQHGVKQGGFAVIDMGNNGNIPYMIFFHHSKFLQVICFNWFSR